MQAIDKIIMIHGTIGDGDKAKSFYEEGLGFQVLNDTKNGDQRYITFMLPGGATLVLSNVQGEMKIGPIKIFLGSNDVESSYNDIMSRGVKAVNGLQEGWGKWDDPKGVGQKWFEVHDDDGNQILVIPAGYQKA